MEYRHEVCVRRLQKENQVTVVFFAMCLSMWRYQSLYERMMQNRHFRVYIVLAPCISFTDEQQRKDIQVLRDYFKKHGVCYIDYDFASERCIDIRKDLRPDILFYPQPYKSLFRPEYDSANFYDKLLCYYPYAFWTVLGEWSYNMAFHNFAWKLYYSTELHRQDAIQLSFNRGRNVVVVGYPNADIFLNEPPIDVWKPQKSKKKRLIWAPHFTISQERSFVCHSNFLWMADLMLDIAFRYSDCLQLAFKPHPRLLTELYLHPEWGKERADAYYSTWHTLENTQLDEDEFKDLFMTSDAMIHDCGSFAVEYHYSLKPVMYVLQDKQAYTDTLSQFGRKAIEAHYIGKCQDDIVNFIKDIVLDGQDVMLSMRQKFYQEYLLPPNGKQVADNTIDDLLKSLGRI